MDSKIDKVLIELRPRIQAANFFLLFKKAFAQYESTKIDLETTKIKIKIKEDVYEINLTDHFNILTKTLSTLLIKNNYVCFRINTNMNEFSSEILPLKRREIENYKLDVSLNTNMDYFVICANCECQLTPKSLNFKRILELPSESMDMSDWFCHKHAADGPVTEEPHSHSNNNRNFTPKNDDDLLYGPFFALLHSNLFENIRNKNEKYIFCRRCLLYFGEILNNSYKFWYENIKFIAADKKPKNNEDDEEDTNEQTENLMFKQGDLLNNFLFLIKKAISDHTMNTFMDLPPLFKLIFKTNKINGDVYYLLVQIMDQHLDIFKMNEVDENKMITLEPFKTMKLLYKYEKFEKQPFVEYWLHDPSVVSVQISEKMFTAAIKELDHNSYYIPECYRVNLGFSLSYLDT